MPEPTIICPNGHTEIKLTESLAAPLIAATRAQFEQRLAQQAAEMAKRESALKSEQAALASTDPPTANACPKPANFPDRARAATGELGYHGQEGYKTPLIEMTRNESIPTTADPNYISTPYYDGYDPNYPEGYQTRSTGLLQVGARDYDPIAGRFLQPDPEPIGPDLQWGQNNRWAYCANDPVNASDPSGRFPWALLGLGLLIIGTGMQIASYFMAPGQGAAWTGAVGVLLAAVGGALLGHFGGLGPALSQLGTLINAAAPALFRLLAFFIAWIVTMLFGSALDSCTRSAIQGISTFQQFTSFVGKLFADASRATKERSTPEFTPVDARRGLEVLQLSMRYT